jgi:hypothetical protein
MPHAIALAILGTIGAKGSKDLATMAGRDGGGGAGAAVGTAAAEASAEVVSLLMIDSNMASQLKDPLSLTHSPYIIRIT